MQGAAVQGLVDGKRPERQIAPYPVALPGRCLAGEPHDRDLHASFGGNLVTVGSFTDGLPGEPLVFTIHGDEKPRIAEGNVPERFGEIFSTGRDGRGPEDEEYQNERTLHHGKLPDLSSTVEYTAFA
jgi:hypothetical protein